MRRPVTTDAFSRVRKRLTTGNQYLDWDIDQLDQPQAAAQDLAQSTIDDATVTLGVVIAHLADFDADETIYAESPPPHSSRDRSSPRTPRLLAVAKTRRVAGLRRGAVRPSQVSGPRRPARHSGAARA